MFTRQHYQAIAATLAPVGQDILDGKIGAPDKCYRRVTSALCQMFAEDNERFSTKTFYDAIKAGIDWPEDRVVR